VGPKLGRQLVATPVAIEGVLGRVDVLGLGEDLAGGRLLAAGLTGRGVGGELRRVDGDRPNRAQAELGAEGQDLGEVRGEGLLVVGAEAHDRGVGGVRAGPTACRACRRRA
jgi:hypothetical protein